MEAQSGSRLVVKRFAVAAFACAIALAAVLERGGAHAAPAQRPNVLLVVSDDQDQASMAFMPRILRRIGEKGATFPDSFTNWSLCCPSRATQLTGQYAINHGVRGNDPPSGGYERFRDLHADSNLATWMRGGGYATGYVGKFLNGYPLSGNAKEVPPGWDEWYGATRGVQNAYGYDLNENGAIVSYGTAAADFKGDVLTAKAVDFISRRAPVAQPFFLTVGYTAPHSATGPAPQPPADCAAPAPKPAPRHATAFDAQPLPKPPSFNEADVSDKPAAIRALPKIYSDGVADIQRRHRCRLESLLHVDEGVGKMLDALGAAGELGNTLVIYTSDNGFLMGEHRIRPTKNLPYEEAMRVPLLMRGPGIPQNVSAKDMVINADLAPTILDAANTSAGLVMDGRSLLPAAAAPDVLSGRALLIEKGKLNDQGKPVDADGFIGIRTRAYKYVEYGNGDKELYHLRTDLFEERSLHADPAYDATEASLASRLASLRTCSGASCRTSP